MACRRDFTPPGLPTLNPPAWYLLVSEIKLLLPLGHSSVGDPLLSPSLHCAEIRHGGRMVPAAAGGQAAASQGAPAASRGTVPCQPHPAGLADGEPRGKPQQDRLPPHSCQIRQGLGHPPVLQHRHREAPGCQLRTDRGVQGPVREPAGSRVRAAPPTQGRSERGHGDPRMAGSPSWLQP